MAENVGAAAVLARHIAQQTAGFIQSSNHRDLLDIVDSLRSHGVSHYVDLPQIIVCGSQSCGKSSTLESLSGISFPTSEGLCTRFATELVLRRGEEPGIRVHIQPGAGRSEDDRARLAAFSLHAADQRDLPRIIDAAKDAMGLSGDGSRVFSTDVLRVESTSPAAPNLTLVDLPGLFGAADKNQSDDDAALVQDLVVAYMRQRRSIILAVVTADNPFANQPVTKFAREIDPAGRRTLGLITKPDKIDRGSEGERYYVELAQNQNVKLSLGWHVLRNRSHTTAEDTAEERDEREAGFFADSVWGQHLEASQLGVAPLRDRLRKILWQQIKEGLPGVKSDVQAGIKECEGRLEQLGRPRTTAREKHTYLQRISSRLTKLVRAAIDGVYADAFFESRQEDVLDRRLRANVQLILAQYADEMRTDGHAREVVEDGETPQRSARSAYVMRAAYLDEVRDLMVKCRGRELPGTFNPLVVGDLFSQQCNPWEAITQDLVERIHDAAANTLNKLVSEICDSNTQTRLMTGHVQPALHELRKALKAKVGEFLAPHLSIHPITYNDYLTESVQKIQLERHTREFDRVTLDVVQETAESATKGFHDDIDLRRLLQGLKAVTAPDVEADTASLAADVAAAYYKIALKKFIDDVSVNAVETRLVQRLPDVFSPNVVWDLSDEAVERLGSEDESTVAERAGLTKKLNILEKGLRDLDAFTVRFGTGDGGGLQ
ncbi:Interferon-induced GTP-binding protein Mx [Pleurostoma richardsiae]|uniref:Interferon-induced GTP-binding protein Mx n=1 Tax=Pleurostoma richardsiae TaxID=41990 RepID=A0AA38RFB1_9PEZI|nr:Interferon-induced GTP-binding protein Mx [Pleurostoma richardsiae]